MNQRKMRGISLPSIISLSVCVGVQNPAFAADENETSRKIATKSDAKKSDSKKSDVATTADDPKPGTLPATEAVQAKLNPEKREAIKRLMKVTRLPAVADKMYDMLLSQGEKSFELNLTRSIQEDPRYTEDQKKELMPKVVGSAQRMFARYRELLPKEINLPDVLESISTTVYDKYFTAKELNDISDFYQTEAGKKALDVLPQVMQESAQMTGEVVTPKVRSIVSQVVQEERLKISSESEASTMKSTTTSPATSTGAPADGKKDSK